MHRMYKTMEDSYVKTKVEALEDNRSKVTITLDAADVDARIKATYKDFANKYNFPGFRKGKAPRPVIDNALGKEAVRATVSDEVVNGLTPIAIDEKDLYPISKPEFADEPGLVEGGKPYSFSFTIECKPVVELSNYDAVDIELPGETATDEEIDDQIEHFREHYYTFKDAPANTKVKADSELTIALKTADDAGKPVESLSTDERPYTMGAGLLPDEFEEKLVGLKKGEVAEFDLDMPENPPVLLRALKGKTAKLHFEVTVKAVRKKILPEVTDEWAKETLGFEDVADLRSRLAESLTTQKQQMMPGLKERACLNKLIERVDVEVPASMAESAETNLLQELFQQLQASGMSFDAYLEQMGLKADTFKDDIKLQAADTVKQDLALDAWARHFDMKVTGKEITEEFVKSGAEDPAALEEDWRKNGQLHMVREGVLRMKAVKDIMDKANVTEAKPAAKKAAEKKPAAKKAAAKSDDAEAKPAKKSAAKKTAAKSEDKPAAKKTAAKKPAAKKTAKKASDAE